MNRKQVVTVVLAGLVALGGAIVAKDPASLGLTTVASNWIGVALVVVGAIQAALASQQVQSAVGLRPKEPPP